MNSILNQEAIGTNKRLEILMMCAQFFYEKGYRRTNLEDVANQLNITKPAIYYYFKNKEEILCELYTKSIDYLLENIVEVYQKDERSELKLKNMIIRHVEVITSNIPLITIFFQEKNELSIQYQKEIANKKRKYEKIFIKVLQNGMDEGEFIVQDPVLLSRHILGMCNWLYQWYDPNGKYSEKDIGENIASVVLRGVIYKGKELNGI